MSEDDCPVTATRHTTTSDHNPTDSELIRTQDPRAQAILFIEPSEIAGPQHASPTPAKRIRDESPDGLHRVKRSRPVQSPVQVGERTVGKEDTGECQLDRAGCVDAAAASTEADIPLLNDPTSESDGYSSTPGLVTESETEDSDTMCCLAMASTTEDSDANMTSDVDLPPRLASSSTSCFVPIGCSESDIDDISCAPTSPGSMLSILSHPACPPCPQYLGPSIHLHGLPRGHHALTS